MTSLTKEIFLKSVSKHKMVIVNDDENKHLRFSDDDGGQIFEVITWNNHLVITGTVGTAVFSGVMGSSFSSTMEDMFSYFKSNDLEIDIEDFSKSMVSVAVDDYKKFSYTEFEKGVYECFDQMFEQPRHTTLLAEKDEIKESLNHMLSLCNDRYECGEYAMCQAIDWRYYLVGSKGDYLELDGFWEYGDFKYPTYRHIWRLYAIVWAIQQYDLSKKALLNA